MLARASGPAWGHAQRSADPPNRSVRSAPAQPRRASGYPGPVTTRAASVLRATTLAAVGLMVSGCSRSLPWCRPKVRLPGCRWRPAVHRWNGALRDLAIVAAEADVPGNVIKQAVNPSAAAVDVLVGGCRSRRDHARGVHLPASRGTSPCPRSR